MISVLTTSDKGVVSLDGRTLDLTNSGDTAKAYRTCTLSVINADNLRESVMAFQNGKELRVLHDKTEIFRGVIFNHGMDTNGKASITAYDHCVYLTKSSDTVNYKNKTASAILKELCAKYGIPTGNIANTGFVIKKHIVRGKTLYDIVQDALVETQKQTGKRYRIRAKAGKVELVEVTNVESAVVIENGRNLMSGNYSESIEDVRTKVKLTGGDEKKPVKAEASAGNVGTYGIMQHYEHLGDVKKSSELTARANALAKEMSKPKKSFSIEALGDIAVNSGITIGVKESMTRQTGKFFVEADTHKFAASGLHTMSLTLSTTGG